jgi:uncharacterized protein involved in exopolysaccharide biosynthesis/Mrp family chromosome partitioning ATPase
MTMEQRQFFLRDILSVIFKHKTLITLFPIVVFGVVFVGNYVWPPTYESEARVRLMRGREVSQADTTVTQASESITMVQMGIEDVNSEIELLHSDDLLRRVVLEMGFDKDPNFPYSDWVFHQPLRLLRWGINGVLYTIGLKNKPDNITIAVDELNDRIITDPIRDSHVLEVRLRMGSPKKAQEILEKILDEYQQYHIEIFSNAKSVPFFTEQRKRVEDQLAKAQADLQSFRKEANISLLATEEELLLQQYTEAKKVLTQLEEISEAVSAGDLDSSVISSLSGQTDSPVVREMQLRLLELLLEQNRVIQSLGPKHPQVLSLREQVRIAQNNLLEAIANTRSLTQKKADQVEQRLLALNETKAAMQKKEMDAGIASSQYDYYSKKLEEAYVADELALQSISNVRVISSPSLPIDPVIPSKLMNLAMAIVGGILGALALAFFLDYLDHGIKTPEDVEFYTKLSPLASFWKGRKLDMREAERLAILLDSERETGKGAIIQVTSSVNGEGAPAIANGLAQAFGNDPKARTLLVDFTGDTPGSKTGPGVSDVLMGSAGIDNVFTTSDTLTVVGRGAQGDAYLWGSGTMDNLMHDLRARYQYIIFSVGPILQTHDSLKLARHVDGVIITIKADSTRREVVNRAVDTLKEARPKVLGAVLTERTQSIPQAVYRRI